MKHLIAQFRDNAPGKITRDQIKAWSLHPPSEITRLLAPVWTEEGRARITMLWWRIPSDSSSGGTDISVLQSSPDYDLLPISHPKLGQCQFGGYANESKFSFALCRILTLNRPLTAMEHWVSMCLCVTVSASSWRGAPVTGACCRSNGQSSVCSLHLTHSTHRDQSIQSNVSPRRLFSVSPSKLSTLNERIWKSEIRSLKCERL